MRFLVTMISAGAALTLIAASGLMNWVFMTSLGKSELERQILGAVSIAVSAFIALLPTLLVWAWREGRSLYLILGVPVFLGFAAFSLSSAVGFAAKNRGSIGEDRALATTQLADVKQEIEQAETAQKAFGNPRSFAVLQELLRGLEQDRRWQSSKSCTGATAEATLMNSTGRSKLIMAKSGSFPWVRMPMLWRLAMLLARQYLFWEIPLPSGIFRR